MLKFIGSGSAFNTKLGNTSAYIKEDDKMLLIDCGELTFNRILKLNLLYGVNELHILVTHAHSDHIGSLSSLIMYSYFIKKIKPNLYIPNTPIYQLINLMGITDEYCNIENMAFISTKKIENMSLDFFYIHSTHCKEIDSYSIVITAKNDKLIFYSGDSSEINDEVLNFLKEGSIDYFYQDACKADYDGNVHLSLRKLTELIPKELRHKVYCIHLDNGFDKEEVSQLGFNVVENIR